MRFVYIKFLAILGILIILLNQANALDCYKCRLTDDNCKDPFNTIDVSKESCIGSCVKVKAKDSDSQAAERFCSVLRVSSDQCGEQEYNGIPSKVCSCNGNLCNYALPVGSSIIVMASSIIIYIALR